MHLVKLASLATVVLVAGVAQSYAANAQHGLDLAKRWCASCHVVSPDQQSASADVPPFATIAQSPNFNTKAIGYFLLDPHPKMPELPLSRAAADDIGAYIQSLKK
jgi:mono/diheme cytochrome c family protein